MDNKTIFGIAQGLRDKLMLFANDSYINHAFRGEREGANCFTWEDLNNCNIFLRIPADKVEQWGGAINLMYTQLIRFLERRPERYTNAGKKNIQTLLLMDEFARFGKLEAITSAMATLRSKNVNICLMLQSLAQLDKIYGAYDKRIIMDNCQYQAILRANDADTQKYLSELIGTCMSNRRSASENMDEHGDITGYGIGMSETREHIVQPHELSTLNDVLLLTPYGYCRVEKLHPSSDFTEHMLHSILAGWKEALKNVKRPSVDDPVDDAIVFPSNRLRHNEGAAMMTIKERAQNAAERLVESKRQHWPERRKRAQRKNENIVSLVKQYLPELIGPEPGTQDGDEELCLPLEAFLIELSSDQELMSSIIEKARYWQQPGVILGPEDLKCVSGQDKPSE